jgi:hypothetical protein
MGVGIHNPCSAYTFLGLEPAKRNNHVIKYTEAIAVIPLGMVVSAAQKKGKTCLSGGAVIIFQRGKATSIGSPRGYKGLRNKIF